MTNLVISSVRIVVSIDQFDAPSNEVFGVGETMRYATDGSITPGNGTTTTEAAFEGIATIASDRVGQAITVLRDGILDVGDALADVPIGTAIYGSDTDGQLTDDAGDSTVDVILGRVIPAWGGAYGVADKLLLVRKGG